MLEAAEFKSCLHSSLTQQPVYNILTLLFYIIPPESLEYFKSPHALAARVILMMLGLHFAVAFTLLRHINRHLKVYLSAGVKRYWISACVCVYAEVCVPSMQRQSCCMCMCMDDTRTSEVECRAVVVRCTDERCTYDVRRFCKSCGGQLSQTNRESFKVLL